MLIEDVWKAIDEGKTVNWHHEYYIVFSEKARDNCEYQNNHFTFRNGKILMIKHIETNHMAILQKSEINDLFIKKAG